jgi:hypothetical protein
LICTHDMSPCCWLLKIKEAAPPTGTAAGFFVFPGAWRKG